MWLRKSRSCCSHVWVLNKINLEYIASVVLPKWLLGPMLSFSGVGKQNWGQHKQWGAECQKKSRSCDFKHVMWRSLPETEAFLVFLHHVFRTSHMLSKKLTLPVTKSNTPNCGWIQKAAWKPSLTGNILQHRDFAVSEECCFIQEKIKTMPWKKRLLP